jgi:hypothetical protein
MTFKFTACKEQKKQPIKDDKPIQVQQKSSINTDISRVYLGFIMFTEFL